MLLIDVSSVMHTGASSRVLEFGQSGEFKLRCIPYIMEKIASYYSESENMIAVFETIHKIPALAREGGYKSGRPRNPLVEWEVRALRKIFEYINFPILEVKGQESDYIINNFCRLNKDKQKIIILSADMDLSSNVSDAGNGYSTVISSFSTQSYNINKSNFELITGVPYNFMNLNKMLLGCSSDKIKPFPKGEEIFNQYVNQLYYTWKRKYGFNRNEHRSSDLVDVLIHSVNNYDAFLEWFKYHELFSTEAEKELSERWNLVSGPKFEVASNGVVDWDKYNEIISVFNKNKTSSIKTIPQGKFNIDVYNDIVRILEESANNASTVFESNLQVIDFNEEEANLENVMVLLNMEGDL